MKSRPAEWCVDDLHQHSHLPLQRFAALYHCTVHRIEVGGTIRVADKLRHGHVSQDVWRKIVEALARYGVELPPESNVYGAGARWTAPRAARTASS